MKGVNPFAEKMIELIILLQFPNLMGTSWERGCRKACTFQKNYLVPCEVAYCHKKTCHVAPSHVWLVQFLKETACRNFSKNVVVVVFCFIFLYYYTSTGAYYRLLTSKYYFQSDRYQEHARANRNEPKGLLKTHFFIL